ncbi:NAD(P)H-hydrate dehydratase [Sphingomicrobium marinum]|uniref:NAD(P)H-hydrate dehydratase n=1 Tax=Sphingomicrobium marinum TaxID=1227950 RepID=UPI00223F9845|nr:NAD(P)H-hydrate dehydratase [Sphingomicrobium marinum]
MTRPILTAEAMREAEQAAIDAGTAETELMERAGKALAYAVHRMSHWRSALLLTGPGNNGGDAYVAARYLKAHGFNVRIAALSPPKSDAAKWAADQWGGEVEELGADTPTAPVVIDAMFGTGLKRPLEDELAANARRLIDAAKFAVACDLPSGIDTDSGEILTDLGALDATVTFGALKPAHRLAPSMHRMGRVLLRDIGLGEIDTDWHEIADIPLPPLDPMGHKYSRGLVHCLSGAMPGAIALSAKAAARAGAGYVRVSTSRMIDGLPSAIVQTEAADALDDDRIGCLLVGPGMGDIPPLFTVALTKHHPLVIDADALKHVGEPERLQGHDAILTPHEGEFKALFGDIEGSKADRALIAAQQTQCVVVYKGPDTLVASPDGRLGFAPPAPAWLASAGTGDVLAGIIAAHRARGMEPFKAACSAVYRHGRAAEQAGEGMIADDLVDAL